MHRLLVAAPGLLVQMQSVQSLVPDYMVAGGLHAKLERCAVTHIVMVTCLWFLYPILALILRAVYDTFKLTKDMINACRALHACGLLIQAFLLNSVLLTYKRSMSPCWVCWGILAEFNEQFGDEIMDLDAEGMKLTIFGIHACDQAHRPCGDMNKDRQLPDSELWMRQGFGCYPGLPVAPFSRYRSFFSLRGGASKRKRKMKLRRKRMAIKIGRGRFTETSSSDGSSRPSNTPEDDEEWLLSCLEPTWDEADDEPHDEVKSSSCYGLCADQFIDVENFVYEDGLFHADALFNVDRNKYLGDESHEHDLSWFSAVE